MKHNKKFRLLLRFDWRTVFGEIKKNHLIYCYLPNYTFYNNINEKFQIEQKVFFNQLHGDLSKCKNVQ